jgi:hypothetical protein
MPGQDQDLVPLCRIPAQDQDQDYRVGTHSPHTNFSKRNHFLFCHPLTNFISLMLFSFFQKGNAQDQGSHRIRTYRIGSAFQDHDMVGFSNFPVSFPSL